MKLTIGYLYPHQMNIYGDRGNIITLQKRCEWRDIEVVVNEYDLGSKIEGGENDLYFFGGGQDQEQVLASQDLQTKTTVLKQDFQDGAVFLSICGGYQLLGKYYQDSSGKKLAGIGLVDTYTVFSTKRMIGNLILEINPQLGNFKPTTLVGFENHSGKTYLGPEVKPLGKVIKGSGNNGEDGTEGATYKTFFGCYLHGSLLPKNPHFADFLLELAIKRKDPDFKLEHLDDSVELKAHQKAIEMFR